MPIIGAIAMGERGVSKRYQLTQAALVTENGAASGLPTAYVKNRQTGALYHFGAEEYFLLSGLRGGLPPAALISPFKARMRLSINAETIEQFAEQMVANGILELADARLQEAPPMVIDEMPADAGVAEGVDAEETEEEVQAIQANDRSFDMTALDEGLEDEDEDADDDEDSLDLDEDDLETLVFGDTENDSVTAPPFDRGGAAESVAARREAPETSFGAANPHIARRKMRFRDKRSQPRPAKPMDWPLFDPSGLLRALNAAFGPAARLLSILTLPLGVLAVLAIFHRLGDVLDTLFTSHQMVSLAGILAISLVTVSLVSRLVTGAVLQREGAEVRSFGINFLFFLIPRFAVDMTELHKLDRDGKMQVFAAGLRTRFLLFALCTFVWMATRQSGSLISDLAAIIGQFGLFSFLISAFPLFPGEGYRLMSAYFEQPMLRERSLAYLFGVKRAGKEPPSEAERWAFVLYGIGSLLTSAFLATLLVAYASTTLEGRFGGAGVVIFIGLLVLIIAWFIAMRARSKRLREQVIAEMVAEQKAQPGQSRSYSGQNLAVAAPQRGRALQRRSPLGVALPDQRRPNVQALPGIYGDNDTGARLKRWLRRGIYLALLAGAFYIAFLPYNYETGGDFVILPNERVQVVARVSSELSAVMVDEGDVVDQGDLLATQISIRELHSLNASRAQLAKARANLQRLRDGATPEEIRVAMEQVERHRAELPFLKSEVDRAMKLSERGTMSASQAERTMSDYETGKAELRSAEANLERVRAQAQDSEIAMAQADVERLESEVAYDEIILDATRIIAPVTGRVVVAGEEPVPGQYLKLGDLLLEIEDHTIARAEIKVPEADVDLIEIGDQVRLKAWARPGEELTGTVSAIAPVADAEEFGKVVRIKTLLENENGFFRPGMSGFAKVDGAQMYVWEAFSRLFVRFVQIELWGWIP